jgi:large subunit ribosomal protein L23
MSTIYDVLRRPLVTEKTSYQSGKLNQYSFIVSDSATRKLVKDAVETLYDVTVERVNIINTPAKRGRRLRSRRLLVRKSGFKKAIVTLAEGQTLQIFEGVQ